MWTIIIHWATCICLENSQSDHGAQLAFVQGALISLGENLDLSFLYRNISPAFQSLYSDAFTENSVPNNEKGFYAGLSFRPAAGLQAEYVL